MQTARKSFNLTSVAALVITTDALPLAVVGATYSVQLAATGGVLPYTWSLGSGTVLPAGLTLEASGLITGTPTESGNFAPIIQVVDSAS